MKTEELIRYYKANIEAIEKGLNNDSLSADKKFRLGYTQQALDGYKSALQELLGNNNIINFLMGKGFNLGAVHLAVQVYTLGFLGKYYRNMKILCCNTGNANTGSFNSEDLGDGAV